MNIISIYKSPHPPPGKIGERNYTNEERRIPVTAPLYNRGVVVQKLEAEGKVYINDDLAFDLLEDFNLERKDAINIMRENFYRGDEEDVPFYLNSSWCIQLEYWAACDGYVLNPYPKDTLLKHGEKRKDYYCKFFINRNSLCISGVSFHEVREKYNGVERIQ